MATRDGPTPDSPGLAVGPTRVACGVTTRSAERWAALGLLSPPGRRSGSRRWYTHDDVVELLATARLLRHGVPVPAVDHALARFRPLLLAGDGYLLLAAVDAGGLQQWSADFAFAERLLTRLRHDATGVAVVVDVLALHDQVRDLTASLSTSRGAPPS